MKTQIKMIISVLIFLGIGAVQAAWSDKVKTLAQTPPTQTDKTPSVLPPTVVSSPVNLNTTDANHLAKEIKGVGKATAEAIIAYRTAHGPFKSIEELHQVEVHGRKLSEAFVKRVQTQLSL